MQIIPTILEKDFVKAEARVKLIKDHSRWIQVDVIDNVYTKGKTFELELLSKLDFDTDQILWDIHLMVKEPIGWVKKCVFAGASRIIGQVEMMKNREEFINTVKDEGMEAGLAFDMETDIDDRIPEDTDLVLLLGRRAGFESQGFEKKVLEKIKAVRQIVDKREKKFLIAVDGGIQKENVEALKEAGVNVIYSGRNYFELINDKNN